MFTACLNWADFASDWLVVLQYGCIIGGSLPRGSRCHADAEGDCEEHPWWFGIGLALLVVSNLLQSFMWSVNSYLLLSHRGYRPKAVIGRMLMLLGNFVLGCCQLHYLVDIFISLKFQKTPQDSPKLADCVFWRELVVKVVETIPQLYLQLYVLLALEGHENAWRLASLGISVAALGHGLVQVLILLPENERKSAARREHAHPSLLRGHEKDHQPATGHALSRFRPSDASYHLGTAIDSRLAALRTWTLSLRLSCLRPREQVWAPHCQGSLY